MVKLCVILAKYLQRRDERYDNVALKYFVIPWVSFVKSAFVKYISY